MDKLNLRKIVKKFGAAKLTEIIGMERLESIHAIMQERVTENQLADILLLRFGTQIFTHKDFRLAILHTLPKEALSYLAYGDPKAPLSEKDLSRLEKATWSRTSEFTERVLLLFELGPEYMPQIKHIIPSVDVLETDTVLLG